MSTRTARTTVALALVLACFGVGTAIGVGLTSGSDAEPTALATTADAAAPAPSGGAPGSAVTSDSANGSTADADDAVPSGDAHDNDAADGADGQGEQAPPEGDERPPARDPQVPDLELEVDPNAFAPPVLHVPNPGGPNNNDDNNGGNGANNNPNLPPAPPAPRPQPLAVYVDRLGGGPLWENGWQRRCNGSAMLTNTFVLVHIGESPRRGPYTVTATARAGQTTRNALVQVEAGVVNGYRVSYGFPRGSVRQVTDIQVIVTVTNAAGQRASVTVGGRPGTGHRLIPADTCP